MKKRLKIPGRSYTRVFAPNLSAGMNRRTDSRVLEFSRAESAYNVRTESGALRDGYGVEETEIEGYYSRIFRYKVYNEESERDEHYYIGYDERDGTIAVSGAGDEWQKIAGVSFASPPLGTNYRLNGEDVYLLCGEEGMAVVNPSFTAVTVSTAPKVTSLAMHNERMFVTIGGRRNAVWFSDDLDPTNWNPELDEGGFIELEGGSGRLNKVVDFGGYVYVFRDYGISRLTAYGEQSEFSVSNLFVSSGRIYADTVAVCGDRILFYAEDGLYSFDGLNTSRIVRALDGLVNGTVSPVGAYSAGKYFLSFSEKGEARDSLTVIDPRTKEYSVTSGVRIDAFSPVTDERGEVLLVKTDRAEIGRVTAGARYYGESLPKVWRSGLGDLGAPERRKLITEAYVDTRYDCRIKVFTENGEKSFSLSGKSAVQRLRVNLTGTKAGIEIAADGEISVARPVLIYATL